MVHLDVICQIVVLQSENWNSKMFRIMLPEGILLKPEGCHDAHFVVNSGARGFCYHYNDVIMGMIASQITSLTIVYSIIYSDADQRKHQSSASLAFVRGIHRRPVNSTHKWPVTRKMVTFVDVIIMTTYGATSDDKVGIMSMLGFHLVMYGIIGLV